MHDDLTAESLVLEDERCTIAIVCLDIIYITLQRTQRICRAANRATGITVDNIMISTSYNHSGPDLNTPECEEWSSFSKAKVVDAACEGWFCRQDASIGVGVSSVTGIGVNRRGKSSIDNSVGVLRVQRLDVRPLAILMNYSCHAVVPGPNDRLISADYPGYAQRYVKAMLGCEDAVVMFTNSASGKINTDHSADELGKRLADAVMETLGTIRESQEVLIDEATCLWKARYRRDLPSPEETTERIRRLEKRLDESKGHTGKDIDSVRLDLTYQSIIMRNVKELGNAPTGNKLTEIQRIRVGDAVFLSLPGEVLIELGLDIKAKSPLPYTFVVGYTNDYIGHIPTKEAFSEGGYEVSSSKFPQEIGEEPVETATSCVKEICDRNFLGRF